jgi:predicted metalloendopeptidase
LGCDSIKTDDLDGYNIVTKQEALSKYNFDWEKLATKIGYKTVPNTFICSSTNYLKCIMETLLTDNAWQSDKWRSYYLYINFRQVMRFHSKWRIDYFDFHGKFIKGQPVPYPQDIYPVFGLSLCFNTFLTNEYIDKNKKQQYIDYTHNMAADLLTIYKRIIKRNTWLSPKTKKYALLKLEHINLVIGSPKLLREDPILDYSNKEAYQNMRLIAYWRTKQMIELDGKSSEVDIPTIDWEELKMVGKQSYIVNAYYTPTENSIYVPLAYLQKPFIDLDERGIEYNLAHIGYTLGHEMSHCLDDLGSKYNEKGNLHNWWTKHDRNKFNVKVKNVIKQYEQFAGYDGIKMDASLSTGENLADISGLAICEEYLKDFQDNNDDIVPIKALSFHAFFVYLAIQARQKIFDEAVKAQLKTNPHPMDKYRTNCPLARLELFRSLYNIKKKNKMFWASTDTIW